MCIPTYTYIPCMIIHNYPALSPPRFHPSYVYFWRSCRAFNNFFASATVIFFRGISAVGVLFFPLDDLRHNPCWSCNFSFIFCVLSSRLSISEELSCSRVLFSTGILPPACSAMTPSICRLVVCVRYDCPFSGPVFTPSARLDFNLLIESLIEAPTALYQGLNPSSASFECSYSPKDAYFWVTNSGQCVPKNRLAVLGRASYDGYL